jgi:hypothetical protein
MTSFNQLVRGLARWRPHRESSTSNPSAEAPVAFASLVDLVRSSARREQIGEVCEDCRTLNRRGAYYCKACLHKLPAYYDSADAWVPLLIWRRRAFEEGRTGAWDFAAVWVVLSLLVLITAFNPAG